MVPMPSTDTLSPTEREALLTVARQSIRHGLDTGRPLPAPGNLPLERLYEPGASFVTLHMAGHLRGCIGSLEAYRPLVEDVSENAFAAAFRDPRFPPLSDAELPQLQLSLSVLTPAEPIDFNSEQELLATIQPDVDGLILEDGGHRGTFLPSVWESLPDPRDFLQHLKQKAGLPADYWSDSLRVSRYRTESFGE